MAIRYLPLGALGFALPLMALAAGPLSGRAEAAPIKKVSVCHVPPGDPSGAHTLVVGEPAVASHLRHGDSLGECASGCAANSSLCDDHNPCSDDICRPDGTCAHIPRQCADDGNPCTQSLCSPATGQCEAFPVANGTTCDDANACTEGTVCSQGICGGGQATCECVVDADCDDGVNCTESRCVNNVCSFPARDCGAAASPCEVRGCEEVTGLCVTTPVVCNDGNMCTDDSCNPTSGACEYVATSNPPEPSREVTCNDGQDNDCDGQIDIADADCYEPYVQPTIGPVTTTFTITDPLGRLAGGQVMVVFFTQGQAPSQGTLVQNPIFSADGKTVTGAVPSTLPPGLYLVTVHSQSLLDPPIFNALNFTISG